MKPAFRFSRADMNYVLRGLMFGGHALDDGPNGGATLDHKLADNAGRRASASRWCSIRPPTPH